MKKISIVMIIIGIIIFALICWGMAAENETVLMIGLCITLIPIGWGAWCAVRAVVLLCKKNRDATLERLALLPPRETAEKLRLKSRGKKCLKLVLLFSGIILLVTVIFGIVSYHGYFDAVDFYDEWFLRYGSRLGNFKNAHEYAMYDRVYYYMAIAGAIDVVLGGIAFAICMWRKISFLIVTNERIIGRTIYGDRFQYPLSKVKSAEIVDGKKFYVTVEGVDFPLRFRCIENMEELLRTLKDPSYNSLEASDISERKSMRYDAYKNSHAAEAYIPVVIFVVVIALLLFGVFKGCSSFFESNSDSGSGPEIYRCSKCGYTCRAKTQAQSMHEQSHQDD